MVVFFNKIGCYSLFKNVFFYFNGEKNKILQCLQNLLILTFIIIIVIYAEIIVSKTVYWRYRAKLIMTSPLIKDAEAAILYWNPDLVTWRWKTPLLCNNVSDAAPSYDETSVKWASINVELWATLFKIKPTRSDVTHRVLLMVFLSSLVHPRFWSAWRKGRRASLRRR